MNEIETYCYRFTVLKLINMKSNLFKNITRIVLWTPVTNNRYILNLFTGCSLVLLLQGCCNTYCALFMNKNPSTCDKLCKTNYDKATDKEWELLKEEQDSLAKANLTGGAPIRETIKKPPGEYFANTISAGPNINFKSAKEENTYGQSKHQPGIGAAIGLGTAFPISNKVGVAISIGFKQNNASEKFEYTEPGGGGGSTNYKDDYKYSYAGISLLGQYWITNNLAIAAGPQVDYLVNASLKRGSDSKKESIKNSSITIGLDAKIGLKYEIPNGYRCSKWGLSLFYDHRISRLNKKEDNGFPVPAYRMKSVHLGLNYFICGKCGKPKKID